MLLSWQAFYERNLIYYLIRSSETYQEFTHIYDTSFIRESIFNYNFTSTVKHLEIFKNFCSVTITNMASSVLINVKTCHWEFLFLLVHQLFLCVICGFEMLMLCAGVDNVRASFFFMLLCTVVPNSVPYYNAQGLSLVTYFESSHSLGVLVFNL